MFRMTGVKRKEGLFIVAQVYKGLACLAVHLWQGKHFLIRTLSLAAIYAADCRKLCLNHPA